MNEISFEEAILTMLSSIDDSLYKLKSGLPDPEAVNYYELKKERKLYLHSDVDACLVQYHQLILQWNLEDEGKPIEERRPIIIYIMSGGGYLNYMWMFIDAMNMSKTPIYTVNIGNASSAAALIFLSGNKRFMTPHSRILIHEGSAQFEGDATKVMDATESYKKELKAMKEYILSKTKIERNSLMKKRANDWELSAEYCLANGACEAIVESFDEVK